MVTFDAPLITSNKIEDRDYSVLNYGVSLSELEREMIKSIKRPKGNQKRMLSQGNRAKKY